MAFCSTERMQNPVLKMSSTIITEKICCFSYIHSSSSITAPHFSLSTNPPFFSVQLILLLVPGMGTQRRPSQLKPSILLATVIGSQTHTCPKTDQWGSMARLLQKQLVKKCPLASKDTKKVRMSFLGVFTTTQGQISKNEDTPGEMK